MASNTGPSVLKVFKEETISGLLNNQLKKLEISSSFEKAPCKEIDILINAISLNTSLRVFRMIDPCPSGQLSPGRLRRLGNLIRALKISEGVGSENFSSSKGKGKIQ